MGSYDWKEKAKTEGGRQLERVTIRMVENGFVVECSYAPKKSGKDGSVGWEEPKQHVFESAASALAYVASELGEGGEAEEEDGKPEE